VKASEHELATVVSNFIPAIKQSIPNHSLRMLNAIAHCRTEKMGGHIEACSDCGVVSVKYNSCRNRNCPKCGAIDKEKWLIKREQDILDVRYFHVVFTVPDKLNKLFLDNKVVMYNLLFATVNEVMQDFGHTDKWIGGRIGMTAILHTWGQNLQYHPHLHLIVPAGALMQDGTWKHARNRGKYLFDVRQLSSVFRARFVQAVRAALKDKQVKGIVPDGLFDKDWVVFAKQPFGGAKQVMAYLGRYTHRTAISNDRILHVDQEHVTFAWKDYSQNNKRQVTTMKGEDFLKRFCLHICPFGYTRIRHYGFLSSASKVKSLALIRRSLGTKPPAPLGDQWMLIVLERMGIVPQKCKCCGGKMIVITSLPDKFHLPRAPPKLKSTCFD
jgi:hypothetical protein